MDVKELNRLIDKVNEGIASDEELHLYTLYLNQLTSGEPEWDEHVLGTAENIKSELFYRIVTNMDRGEVRKFSLWPRIAVAASILFILGIAGYFYLGNKTQPVKTGIYTSAADIAPGSNKAILTLGDGSKISLTDANAGTIAKQTGVSVTKTANGQLIYTITDAGAQSENIKSNTVTTPKGGQWQVRLPDGTVVWLNAASALTYPASFAKSKTRSVLLSGEAYFEVAKDKKHPFIVKTDHQEVEVLGTHFNINSYADENTVKTTLLEGSVKVSSGTLNKLLKPGQQSILQQNSISIETADTEEVMAWKNGYFLFNDELIGSIMRKISRWYDVEVVLDSKVTNVRFNGIISRSKKISEILMLLEKTKDVHFKVEGRRVMVMQ